MKNEIQGLTSLKEKNAPLETPKHISTYIAG